MAILAFQKPEKVIMLEADAFQGKFEFRPLEPGYGITIGNALRRILLSSLEGFAITSIKIEGIDHEYSTIPGVIDDVTNIILNLKQVRFKQIVEDIDNEKVTINVSGLSVLKAGDIGKYFSGFEVINDCKVGSLTYVFARRVKQPEPIVKKSYGPLIKLKRLGKNGKVFDVYKMRTMHPYSEYLQAYIYDHYNLQKGGKFNNDIRINTLGGIMRKYFLDEIPMLLNLIRGEMKIVGVRPISNHYFSLYSAELQEKRLKTKPGLLPPFYADMPETMEEIQNSEMKYLIECEKNGTFVTDVKYLRKIIKNIIINKARSA
jgi:lipopolysaccharide/colanic/teichoic acid biosynthesis glycosyltransferase